MQDWGPFGMQSQVLIHGCKERRILEATAESLNETAAPLARHRQPGLDVGISYGANQLRCDLLQTGRCVFRKGIPERDRHPLDELSRRTQLRLNARPIPPVEELVRPGFFVETRGRVLS